MDSSTQTMPDDAKSMNDLFELAEKLTIQLNEKNKELQESRQANEELLANMDSEKIRAIEAATENLNSELAIARQTIGVLQMAFWKSFPSDNLCYYIKVLELGYLYANHADSGLVRILDDPQQQPLPCAGYFKFTKHSDGTFSIYSMLKEKYLQKHIASSLPTFLHFAADECGTVDNKFVLVFHQQDQQPGFMVDIFSLAHESYLTKQQYGFIEANSRTAPANKFLIIPVLDGQ